MGLSDVEIEARLALLRRQREALDDDELLRQIDALVVVEEDAAGFGTDRFGVPPDLTKPTLTTVRCDGHLQVDQDHAAPPSASELVVETPA